MKWHLLSRSHSALPEWKQSEKKKKKKDKLKSRAEEGKKTKRKKKTILCLLAELLFLEHPKCLYCPSTWWLLLWLPKQQSRGFKFLQISKRGYECLIQQATHITKYSARKTSATQTPTKTHSYLSGKKGKEALKSKW